jgi:hypothetical protein
MSIQVVVHEAKGLNGLTGRIKAKAFITEIASYSHRSTTVAEQTSRSVDEYTNVKFDDADFKL